MLGKGCKGKGCEESDERKGCWARDVRERDVRKVMRERDVRKKDVRKVMRERDVRKIMRGKGYKGKGCGAGGEREGGRERNDKGM